MIHSASNGVINSSSLCLVPGQLVRVVYLDAVCLNDSGNSFDAALLACMLALKNGTLFLVICTSVLCLLAKLFVPELDEQAGMVYINDKNSRQSFEIKCFPVSLHYGLFNGS